MSNTDELRKAAQAALECLENLQGGCTDSDDGTVEAITVWCPEIIDALRAALAQPAAPDRWNEGFKHGQWLAKHSAPVVERADSATPVVERDAGNLSDNAAPVAPARWYCVTNYGGATLCTGRDDAAEVAAEQDIAVPRHGPHRAVMLAEVQPAQVPLHEDVLYLMADECETPAWGEWYSDLDALLRFARAIEAHHGITAQGEPK